MYKASYSPWEWSHNPFEPGPIRAIFITREGFVKVQDMPEFKPSFKIPLIMFIAPPFDNAPFKDLPHIQYMEFAFDSWYPGEHGTGVYKQV